MKALDKCAKVIKGISSNNREQNMRDIQRLAGEFIDTRQDEKDTTTEQSTAPRVQPIQMVDTDYAHTDVQTTRSTTSSTPTTQPPTPVAQAPVLAVQPTTAQLLASTSKLVKQRRKIVSTPITVPHTTLAQNMQSQTNAATE